MTPARLPKAIADDGGNLLLDHVVVVVADLDRAVEQLSIVFGRPAMLGGDEVLGYRYAVFILGSSGLRIEVCQPLAPGDAGGDSQASRAFRNRLERFGEGLHCLAFTVENLERARAVAHHGAARLIESEHSESFFLHPGDMAGVLVQLLAARAR